MRPDLFKGLVARVPFVDVVTTMLDDSIPLTTSEYDEVRRSRQRRPPPLARLAVHRCRPQLVCPADVADLDEDGDTGELTPFDLDDNPRFAADELDFDPGCGIPVVVDMGAYEYQGQPFPVKFGDLDGDGIVGIADFLLLLAAWGTCTEECCLADLDFDGEVGVTDFLLLLANWGP